jgi:hypothetical protein
VIEEFHARKRIEKEKEKEKENDGVWRGGGAHMVQV